MTLRWVAAGSNSCAATRTETHAWQSRQDGRYATVCERLLAEFARQSVLFEMGTRYAFHRLMADAGKEHRWTLDAEQEKKVGGKTIRPDGTFKDVLNLVRGYWEAKDTADKLEAEIEKKRKAGYPLNNIIFEDTQTAVLYQHGERILTVDMREPTRLAELVTQFFRYVEPEIEEFEQASVLWK